MDDVISAHAERSHPLAFKASSLDDQRRTCDFVASTAAIDSYDEIVEQDWDLTRYKTNPVVLWAHNSREMVIGRCLRCEVVETIGGRQLECTIEFAPEEISKRAQEAWLALKAGFLNAVSVGFVPGDYRYEKRDGKGVYVLSKNKLHEISVVPVPANPEALAKMKAKAFAEASGARVLHVEGGFVHDGVGYALATNPIAHELAVLDSESPQLRSLKAQFNEASTQTLTAPEPSANGTENHMHENEFKAALAAKDAEIASIQAKATEAERRVADAEMRAASAEERATKLTEENEQLATAAKALLADVDKAEKALGGCKMKAAPAGQAQEPTKETFVELAERVAGEIIEGVVDALVGVKITPAQKDEFIAFAKENRTRFDAVVKGLPDINILGRVVPKDSAATGTKSVDAETLGDLLEQDADTVADEPGDLGDLLLEA